ncbi:unnamed protein product [Miscanthus lutarioriparius]|uniref:Heptahelical transmembrane protein ADIPOR1 n=1 Tax=Miscanthus lutarioriparius TaxID=422564 RepID=A0A811S9K8_9POAL|nr:unnamed protein product [Miscanthus lutarioriparius]
MDSEEGATVCAHAHQEEAAAAMKEAGGGGGARGGGSSRGREGRRRREEEVRAGELPRAAGVHEGERVHPQLLPLQWPILNAVLSLFSWHNETINIWTHLLGLMLFFGLTLVHLGQYFPQVADLIGHLSWPISKVAENVSSNIGDVLSGAAMFIQTNPTLVSYGAAVTSQTTRWPFFVFLAGAMFCLLSSTACHLLSCHSHSLNLFLIRLDYTGIAVMIVVSFFPPIYYIFQCEPHWQVVYLSAITVAGVGTVYALMSPRLSAARYRAHRALLFVGMGLSGVVPAVHAAAVNWHEPARNVTLAYEGAMAASYLVGTAFYLTRVPERWRPGAFDLAGHSHQIFHALVIAGALAHYGAAIVFLKARDEMGCPAS